jgi:hypothetical protein
MRISKKATDVSASWVGLPGGDSEESAIKNSSIIARGKVIDQYTEIRGEEGANVVFTISKVKVLDIFGINLFDIDSIVFPLT